MYVDNHRLGQSQIFAVYADPTHAAIDPWSPPSIRGRLQSHWDLVSRPDPVIDLFPYFAWSDAARQRRIARGVRAGFVLGAAWAYLLRTDRDGYRSEAELEERAEKPPPPLLTPAGTLFLPRHGLQGLHLARRLADHLQRTVGAATVALYPADLAVSDIERAYREHGHAVVALTGVEDEPGSDAPRPLIQLRDLFQAHTAVSSNVPRVELLYAACSGQQVTITGPIVAELDPVRRQLARQLGEFDASDWRTYADRELGTSRVVPPHELRVLLDWTHDA